MKNSNFFRFAAFMLLAFFVGTVSQTVGQQMCTQPYIFTYSSAIYVTLLTLIFFFTAYVAGQERYANKETY